MLFSILKLLFTVALIVVLILSILIVLVRVTTASKLAKVKQQLSLQGYDVNSKVVGFFHPFCDACGGGEKVLF
jgi:hypothetical protein